MCVVLINCLRNSVAILLASVWLAGCATTPVPDRVPSGAARPLASPVSLGAVLAANQVVRGAFGERDATLNCVVSVRDGVITVIGLTALGVRAFTLRFDGDRVTVDANLPIPAQLTPERLLADIQLVYWPLTALASTFEAADVQVSEPYIGVRRVRHGDELVAEVHYASTDHWQGRSWLVDLQHRYTLSIDSTLVPAQ